MRSTHAAKILGGRARSGAPLADRCTYRVGGAAALLVEVADVADLVAVADAVAASGLPTLVVGNGSNLLVADRGFDGIAVVLGEPYTTISIEGTEVVAGAAAPLPVVARRTAAAGLTGFEWAVGVPGTIGGAVRMNAGGHGADMAASLRRVRVFDLATGQDDDVRPGALDLGYRHSAITAPQVVLGATLGLAPGDRARSNDEIAEIVRWRREHQPGGANAGSVFANPPGDSAGRLIDHVGAKGLRVGSAEVSPKHANFIQADPGGRSGDVLAVMREVARRVEDATGVALVPETRLVGFQRSELPPRWFAANSELSIES